MVFKDKTCEHCGEGSRTVYGYDEMSLFCCLWCDISLFVLSFRPHYEFNNNPELVAAKINTRRDILLSRSEEVR